MFQRVLLLRFLLAFFFALFVAFISAEVCFPTNWKKPDGRYVCINNAIVYSPQSAHHFRKLRLRNHIDSSFRILVISSPTIPFSFSDSLVTTLRRKVNDPRLNANWKWSKNWQRIQTAGDGTCLLFRRPAIILPPSDSLITHSYFEGWASCSISHIDTGTVIRLIGRSKKSESIVSLSDGDSVREQSMICGDWKVYEWPIYKPHNLLTLSGDISPEIGALAIESKQGISVCSSTLHECNSNSLREQANLLHPKLIIVLTDRVKLFSNLKMVRELFANSAILVCFSSNRLQPVHMLNTLRHCIEKNNSALLLLDNAEPRTGHISTITQAVEPFIH